jgi:hypothetical protein
MVSGGVWIGRVPGRSYLRLQTGKPGGLVRAFYTKLERRIQLLILLLVKIRSIAGRLTALIV